jgi:hypothetical protein
MKSGEQGCEGKVSPFASNEYTAATGDDAETLLFHDAAACALARLTSTVLIERHRGPQSLFAPYFTSFPLEADLTASLPFSWHADHGGVPLLHGTDVLTGMDSLNPVPRNQAGWWLFFATVLSRAIEYDRDSHHFALVPLLDMANHRPLSKENTTIEFSGENFVLLAKHDIPKGTELTICYGNYGNDDLIFRYGFACGRNQFNRVRVGISDTTQVIAEHVRTKIESDESKSRAGTDVDGEVEQIQICAVRKRMAVEFLATKMAVLCEHLLLPLCILDTIASFLVATDNAARACFSPSLPNRIFQQRMQLQNQPGDMDPRPNNTNNFDEASSSMDAKKFKASNSMDTTLGSSECPRPESSCSITKVEARDIEGCLENGEPFWRYGGATGRTARKPRSQTIAAGFFFIRILDDISGKHESKTKHVVSPELWEFVVGCSLSRELWESFHAFIVRRSIAFQDRDIAQEGVSDHRGGKPVELQIKTSSKKRKLRVTRGRNHIDWAKMLDTEKIFRRSTLSYRECELRDDAISLLVDILNDRLRPLLSPPPIPSVKSDSGEEDIILGVAAVEEHRAYEVKTLSRSIEKLEGERLRNRVY